MDKHFDEDDDAGAQQKKVFDEFECPDCDANNPHDGFRFDEEVLCYYCGNSFLAVDRNGRLKLKEL